MQYINSGNIYCRSTFYECTTKLNSKYTRTGCSMQEKKLFATIFSVLVVSMMIFVTIGTATVMFASAQQQSTNATGTAAEHTEGEAGGTTVRDSTAAVLLAGETIPGGSFIHLYDSTPDAIATGHVAAKIPCDDNSNATLTILTGSAPRIVHTQIHPSLQLAYNL